MFLVSWLITIVKDLNTYKHVLLYRLVPLSIDCTGTEPIYRIGGALSVGMPNQLPYMVYHHNYRMVPVKVCILDGEPCLQRKPGKRFSSLNLWNDV